MALSIPRLKAAIETGLLSLYAPGNMLANRGNRFYTIEQWAEIIASCVINEITGNAKCNGTDSHGDTHGNVGIV